MCPLCLGENILATSVQLQTCVAWQNLVPMVDIVCNHQGILDIPFILDLLPSHLSFYRKRLLCKLQHLLKVVAKMDHERLVRHESWVALLPLLDGTSFESHCGHAELTLQNTFVESRAKILKFWLRNACVANNQSHVLWQRNWSWFDFWFEIDPKHFTFLAHEWCSLVHVTAHCASHSFRVGDLASLNLPVNLCTNAVSMRRHNWRTNGECRTGTQTCCDRNFRVNVDFQPFWWSIQIWSEFFVVNHNRLVTTQEIVYPIDIAKLLIWVIWDSRWFKSFINIMKLNFLRSISSFRNYSYSHNKVLLKCSCNDTISTIISMAAHQTDSSWCSYEKLRLFSISLQKLVS